MRVSMIPSDNKPVIKCSQHDTGLRRWNFQLFNGDYPFTPVGDCSLICSNGAEVPLTLEDDTLYCDCTSELSEQSGIYDCKIKIVNGDEVIHSQIIKLYCEVRP